MLGFARSAEIRERVDIPSCWHGSSHIPDGTGARNRCAVVYSRFNVGHRYFQTFYKGLYGVMKGEQPGDTYKSAVEEIRQGMIEFIQAKMRVLNPAGFSL